MGEYRYNRVDRDAVEDVVLHSIASSEACKYQLAVQDTSDTYLNGMVESWQSNERDFWRKIFSERMFNDFSRYIEECIEDTDNYHPFTIRQTERHIEQDHRNRISELAPPEVGRYAANDIEIARKSLPPVPAAPPNCPTSAQFEWVCRLISTLHYNCPRLPSGFQIRYSDEDKDPDFKFADFITTIRDGRLAVVEITMRTKQFEQKFHQLDDYVWLLKMATGVQPEAYLVHHGLVTETMRERAPDGYTGYYSIQGFENFLSDNN